MRESKHFCLDFLFTKNGITVLWHVPIQSSHFQAEDSSSIISLGLEAAGTYCSALPLALLF